MMSSGMAGEKILERGVLGRSRIQERFRSKFARSTGELHIRLWPRRRERAANNTGGNQDEDWYGVPGNDASARARTGRARMMWTCLVLQERPASRTKGGRS